MNSVAQKFFSGTAILVAVVLLAWASARLAWQVLSPLGVPEMPRPAAAPGERAAETSDRLVDRVSAAHLMGKVERKVVEPARSDAPVTRLNLILVGVFATGSDDGLALVSDGRGQEKMYAIGDELPGGAVLAQVLPDAVLIELNGREERLPLRKPAAATAAARPAARTARAPRAEGPSLAAFRDNVVKNPAQLISMVAARPVTRNGQLKGYALTPRGSGRQMFRLLGLRPGDVITDVNGIVLNNQTAALGALRSLEQASQLDLTVERRGQRLNISRTID